MQHMLQTDKRMSFLKIIIHDLDIEFQRLLQSKCNRLICADGKYAGCQGCFSCWTKHPAECMIHDNLKEISRLVGRADELVIITQNCYGTYSPAVKAILDRSIGISTPLSTYRGKEMHHTLRYGTHDEIKIFAYGNFLPNEKASFELIARRNALNYGYKKSKVIFSDSPEKVMENIS